MPQFTGYRIIEFSQTDKELLKQIAELLIPYEREILERWVKMQLSVWQPPMLSRAEVEQVFGELLHDMLGCMRSRQLNRCIENFARAGADLATRDFPYEALIMSMHFLEESYLPIITASGSPNVRDWLIGLDEFLHAVLAATATAYFRAHRKQLLEEAEVGQVVQEGLMPDIPMRAADLEVASIYISARERARIGGDLVDLFQLAPGRAAFIVGDLSGHGLEAATDAAMLRFLFRGFLRDVGDLTETVVKLNQVLRSELKDGRFATALAGLYEEPGRLTLVSAGHPVPVLCDGDCRLLGPGGTALGVDENASYSAVTAELEPGGLLVAYTDGLIEARGDGGFFGEQRVVDVVCGRREAPAQVIAEYLRDEALRFAGGRLVDDVAILVLKRTR